MNDLSNINAGKCPVMGAHNAPKATAATANQHWWPNQLDLKTLQQKSPLVERTRRASCQKRCSSACNTASSSAKVANT